MADSHADISKHIKLYLGVFAALAVLTVVTVGASRVHFSGSGNVIVALLIAGCKAMLVAVVFMHLKWERSGWIWWPLALCAVFFIALMALPTLTSTESHQRAPGGAWDVLPEREAPAYLSHDDGGHDEDDASGH